MGASTAIVALALLLAPGLQACGGGSSNSGEIVGAGSTAQEVAQEAWIQEFGYEEPDAVISYDAVGSQRGRQQFIDGDAAYAASDVPLAGGELQQAVDRCHPGEVVEVPAYVSRILVVFNIGKTTSILLTPETLAKIFNREITSWRDPAIRRENPSITKFHGSIIPVYRSGDSGTTASFTEYLSEAVPSIWRHKPSEEWPVTEGGVPVERTADVVDTVFANDRTIGYLDASQESAMNLVSILANDGRPAVASPSAGASVRILEGSPEAAALKESPYMLPFDLDRTLKSKFIYPIPLISYLIACTRYDSSGEAAAVKGLLEFVVGKEGQEVAEEQAGADHLRGELQKRVEAAVQAIE